jgi:hypothetical protein
MVQAILVWSGAVVGVSVLLLMALGPVIVEIDSWWYERKHGKAPAKDTASAKNEQPATPQLLHRAA